MNHTPSTLYFVSFPSLSHPALLSSHSPALPLSYSSMSTHSRTDWCHIDHQCVQFSACDVFVMYVLLDCTGVPIYPIFLGSSIDFHHMQVATFRCHCLYCPQNRPEFQDGGSVPTKRFQIRLILEKLGKGHMTEEG